MSSPETTAAPPSQTTTPSSNPTSPPTSVSTSEPTRDPTAPPTTMPTPDATPPPTVSPTSEPTRDPTAPPTTMPTADITPSPTLSPTINPTQSPTRQPTQSPSPNPTQSPSRSPTRAPTPRPTRSPTRQPTPSPTPAPSNVCLDDGSRFLCNTQSANACALAAVSTCCSRTFYTNQENVDSAICGNAPPTRRPTARPTQQPSISPTDSPTNPPTPPPSGPPTPRTMPPSSPPTLVPTSIPTMQPTNGTVVPVSSLSTGETVGIVLGSIVGVILAVVLAILLCRTRRLEKHVNSREQALPNAPSTTTPQSAQTPNGGNGGANILSTEPESYAVPREERVLVAPSGVALVPTHLDENYSRQYADSEEGRTTERADNTTINRNGSAGPHQPNGNMRFNSERIQNLNGSDVDRTVGDTIDIPVEIDVQGVLEEPSSSRDTFTPHLRDIRGQTTMDSTIGIPTEIGILQDSPPSLSHGGHYQDRGGDMSTLGNGTAGLVMGIRTSDGFSNSNSPDTDIANTAATANASMGTDQAHRVIDVQTVTTMGTELPFDESVVGADKTQISMATDHAHRALDNRTVTTLGTECPQIDESTIGGERGDTIRENTHFNTETE